MFRRKSLFGSLILALLVVGAFQAAAQDTLRMLRYGEPAEEILAAGESVQFLFTAEAGDRLILVANAKGGEIDPVLRLYTSEGALVTEDDDGGGKRNARLEGVTAPAAATYTVTVFNAARSGSGAVAVIVNDEAQLIAYHGGGVDSPFSADPGYVGYQLSEPWRTTDLTYAIRNVVSGFPDGAIEQVIAESFQAWSDNTPLRVTRVSDQNA
ncbi:MAG: pre-peptidase C-terminal domain-containing protein, partial [Anaerolineae bacterium]|nr:pre-peptidase C-terminal domain-containing protein [Anaerolineae bacterium]